MLYSIVVSAAHQGPCNSPEPRGSPRWVLITPGEAKPFVAIVSFENTQAPCSCTCIPLGSKVPNYRVLRVSILGIVAMVLGR